MVHDEAIVQRKETAEQGATAGSDSGDVGSGQGASSEELDDRPSDLVLQEQELEMLRSLAPLIQLAQIDQRRRYARKAHDVGLQHG